MNTDKNLKCDVIIDSKQIIGSIPECISQAVKTALQEHRPLALGEEEALQKFVPDHCMIEFRFSEVLFRFKIT